MYCSSVSTRRNLDVFAEWHSRSAMRALRYYDADAAAWRYPLTGGANVPAINAFLRPFGAKFAGRDIILV